MRKSVRKTIDISKLLVNPKNPRFNPVTNQNKALQLMLKQEKSSIKKLAKDITSHGLNPTKNVVVLSKNGEFLTLEGNRRVVVLKLLNDPQKAEDQKFREFFYDLKSKHPKNPETLSCTVFENEDDAHHWIVLEHTGQNQGAGIKSWSSEQKDRFLQKSSKKIQIFEFTDANNIERKGVAATNLERLLGTSHVCDVIGISFLKGELEMKKPKSVVQKNLTKVFSEMSKKGFTVRDIYTKELSEKWIDVVIKTSDSKSAGKPTTKLDEQGTATANPKSLPKSTNRKYLIPSNFELIIKQTKINNIFRELKDDLVLDGSRKATPNAIAVLFRVFLEVSLYHYLEKKGIRTSQRTTITQMITKVADHMEKNDIASSTQLYAIRITSSKAKDILHIDRLHECVHSTTMQPNSDGLKARWDNLQEFFKILWEDLNKKGN